MDHSTLYRPHWREERLLRDSETLAPLPYCAFPALCKADADTVLIVYKRGQKHFADTDSCLEQITWSISKQAALSTDALYQQAGLTPQMGESIAMPNGDICIYIDMQQTHSSKRTGLVELRSTDGGKTYAQRRVGPVAGVEYGYAFDACEKGGAFYLLAMTFPELEGPHGRAVHLLRSEDAGMRWHFVADLTARFGFPFNESTIRPCAEGFLIFTRGEVDRSLPRTDYDHPSGQHLVVTDVEGNVLRMRDYRHTAEQFTLTGRPRLFEFEDGLYLLTRQSPGEADARNMVLDLFRLDPITLKIQARIRLDEPRSPGQDGHYGVAYLDETGQAPILRVVTYVTAPPRQGAMGKRPCDLMQLSFNMRELHCYGVR